MPQESMFSGNQMEWITNQLTKLEERMRDVATRADLDNLRRELVGRETLEPQLTILRTIIQQNRELIEPQLTVLRTLIQQNKELMERQVQGMQVQIDGLKAENLTRQDRLWIRLGQVAGLAGFLLALFELLTHIKII